MKKYRCKHSFSVPHFEVGKPDRTTVVNEGDIFIAESEWLNNSDHIILTKECGEKRMHLYLGREHREFYFEVVEE